MNAPDTYLIWSNEHRAWWAPAQFGYSKDLAGAGRYSRETALRICRDAIPTAMHIDMISEIPVRLADVKAFLDGQMVPQAITGASKEKESSDDDSKA